MLRSTESLFLFAHHRREAEEITQIKTSSSDETVVPKETVELLEKSDLYFFSPEHPPLIEPAQKAFDWAVDEKLKYCTYLIDLPCFYPRNKLLPSSISPAALHASRIRNLLILKLHQVRICLDNLRLRQRIVIERKKYEMEAATANDKEKSEQRVDELESQMEMRATKG
ncbi:hypothetical protein Ahy_B03g062321 isoform A [Arachis hypogaea]|uniref:Uncharacterized protein n=1 Tax=Arachis hypogaea TaxID=3818 RepID=A0A444ZTQ5_ARAHY|nr:hypothetical protein Ahy_B03g062321 isoform A [Arachis hypogaea]